MMTDTAIQQPTDPNGQTLVTPAERQALIQKLAAKWPLDISTTVEKHAYEKSRGVRPMYFRMIQAYHQQLQNSQQNRPNVSQPTGQPVNNNRQFPTQQINLPQQTSAPMLNHPQHPLIHMQNQPQPRLPNVQSRMANPPTAMISNQTQVRLRDPQKFSQSPLNSMSYASTSTNIQPMDVSQNFTSQPQQLNNLNLNDYLSQPSLPQPRYSNPSALVPPRPRLSTSLNANFPSQTASNNGNDVLHQFVVGNPPTNSMTNNIPSSGDRLLQQILLSTTDVSSNKMPLQTRATAPSTMSPSMRSTSATNNTPNNNVTSLRSSLTSHQASPSPPIIIMPIATPPQPSNVQIQPSMNITIQQSPLNNNNNNGSLSANSQIIAQPTSVSTNNHSSSPINRAAGSISSPDEETSNLIKFFKDNINRLQTACQKFTNEGNVDKARNAQAIHQQMLQFINNPTYEGLSSAKHIRDILERALNRPQPTSTTGTTTAAATTTTTATGSVPPIPPVSAPQVNEVNQFEKVVTQYISSDAKKRHIVNEYFVEPLADVINGVPHKKIRLDFDSNSTRISEPGVSTNQLSLLSKLNHELDLLPTNRFSIERLPVSHTNQTIELNDEYLSRNGLVLRCKLLEQSNPLVPTLRLRISTRYPDEPPEILSLTNSTPPKLEFSDGHPFFEQLSTIFVSYLFKLPFQHTVTDILNIWYRSVQSAL